MTFSGVQKFYGNSSKKKDGGWIANQDEYTADDFTIEQECRYKVLPEGESSYLDWAMGLIDFRIGAIKKASEAKTYKLWIGGEGNFRYDAAHILPYKGERKNKPMLFHELKKAFMEKYKTKVCVAQDFREADDEVSIRGWASYSHFVKTGKHKYVLGFIDKDIKQVPCPSFNYDKPELGITTPTIEECCHHFCLQLLKGDRGTDNIPGLVGIGDKKALKLLEGRNTPKEMYEAVVVAYKDYYGLEVFPFTSHRGVESTRTWLDMLSENAKLLRMLRKPGEVYKIEDTFKRLRVDYG